MTKKFPVFIGLFIYFTGIFAQIELPFQCEVAIPRLLHGGYPLTDKNIQDFLKSTNWGQSDKTNHYWVVYSDREDNVTYNKPDKSSGRFSTLNFNEELRIAKIENGFALVYKEEKINSVYPKINKGVSRGWVPMSHLLLWNSCPTNDIGIYQKALPVINVDAYIKNKDNNIGSIFKNPVALSSKTRLMKGMDFYFVMKEDKESGLVLLSRHCNLIGESSQVLYGWVSKASYIPWNNRVCLEPNWDPEVAEKLKGTSAYVHTDGKIRAAIPMGQTNSIAERSASKYRMKPDVMRFPLLEDKNDQYHVIAFVSPSISPRMAIPPKKEILTAVLGYVDKRDSITGLEYWKPVILASNEELSVLLSKLRQVKDTAKESIKDRYLYIKAIKEIIRFMYGDIPETMMMMMDTKQIMALSAGLVIKPESLTGRTIEEIQDFKVVSQDEFNSMIATFWDKYMKLESIYTSDYEFSFLKNGYRWFWIPFDYIP